MPMSVDNAQRTQQQPVEQRTAPERAVLPSTPPKVSSFARAARLQALIAAQGAEGVRLDAPKANGVSTGKASHACPGIPTSQNDGVRHMVVAHPYDENGQKAGKFEVLEVSALGKVSDSGPEFEMGRATFGKISFTPDGRIGIVALEGGTLGVFRLDEDGTPEVVHESFKGSFYASSVVMDPSGSHAWVLDRNWRENGGGIYKVSIDCDGTLIDHGQVVTAQGSAAMTLAGDRAILAAHRAMNDNSEATVHLLELDGQPRRVGGADAFGDGAAIVSDGALSPDGRSFLLGDNSQFSGIPNRVATIGVEGGEFEGLGWVEVPVPEKIRVSPFGGVALVTSPLTDAIYILDKDPEGDGPWTLRGEVPYRGRKPQLPAEIEVIADGPLKGHAFVTEVTAVRHLQFMEDGSIVDHGIASLGDELQEITGAMGLTP